MKTFYLLILASFLLSIRVYADQLELVEKWKAEKAASYLQNEEFVLYTCDCCENHTGFLISIDNVSFEPGYDNYLYTVRLKGRKVSKIEYDQKFTIINTVKMSEEFNSNIDLAYTYVVTNGSAIPIGLLMNFEMRSCMFILEFPNKLYLNNEQYSSWFTKYVTESYIDINNIYGSWRISKILNQREPIIIPVDADKTQRFVFKTNGTFFTNSGDGGSGNFSIKENFLTLKDDIENSTVVNKIALYNEKLFIKINLNSEDVLLELVKQ